MNLKIILLVQDGMHIVIDNAARRNSGTRRIAPDGEKEQKPGTPGIVSLPTRLTRRSSRPAWTFGFIFLAPSARAAERGR